MPTSTVTHGHKTTVVERHGRTTGRTYQAQCIEPAPAGAFLTSCGYRGPHVETPHRANQIAQEHANRTGQQVTA